MRTRIRTGVFCLHEGRLLTIELQDPTTRKRFWSLPGGAIEPGETPDDGAIRETLEETGYRIKLASEAFATSYTFRWNAEQYNCTTHWFKAQLLPDPPETVDDADYLLQCQWLQWPTARVLFTNNPAHNEAFAHFLPFN